MLSVEDARARILAPLVPLAAEILPLALAHRRILARDLPARLAQPPADLSAMDGYALRAADTAPGARLRVIGTAPAGHPFAGAIGPGEAVRLFTGSTVPPGADTILIQEDADRDGDILLPRATVPPGRHIRRTGQDFSAGETILPAGTRLDARALGLAAAANHPFLPVIRRPRVAILTTGDEIALPGEPIPPGGIISSNGPMLAALVAEAGGDASLLPILPDDPAAIATAARAASAGADLLVTTGGASVGDHDFLQAGLSRTAFRLDFWKIAMRPGKPMVSGQLGPTPVLGLPGNPVSAYVCALLFLVPALRVLLGLPPDPNTEPARLGAPLPANDHRADFLRATLRDGIVTPFPRQDSGMLAPLARADALLLRAPHAPAAAAGDAATIIRLDSLFG